MGFRTNPQPVPYGSIGIITGTSAFGLTMERLKQDNGYLGHFYLGSTQDQRHLKNALTSALENIQKANMKSVIAMKSGTYYAFMVPDLSFVNPFTIRDEQATLRRKKNRSYDSYISPEYYGTEDEPNQRHCECDEKGDIISMFGYTKQGIGQVYVLATDPEQTCTDSGVIGGMFGNRTWEEHEKLARVWRASKGNTPTRFLDAISHHSINTHAIAHGDELLGAYGGYDYIDMPTSGCRALCPYGSADDVGSEWRASGRSDRFSDWAVAALVGGDAYA